MKYKSAKDFSVFTIIAIAMEYTKNANMSMQDRVKGPRVTYRSLAKKYSCTNYTIYLLMNERLPKISIHLYNKVKKVADANRCASHIMLSEYHSNSKN